MIDRIGNGNTYTPPYARGGKKAARIEGDAPAFLLPGEDQNGGVIWDRGSKEDIPKAATEKQKKEEKKEEHIPPLEEEKTAEAAEAGEYKQSGFGKFIGRIGEAIKKFFLSIWYGSDKPADGEKASDGSTEADKAPDAGFAEAEADEDFSADAAGDDDREERIRAAIAGNDPGTLVDELTEGGKKHPARNTTLLTHYDRRGRLVKPSDAEAGRILTAESSNKGKGGRNVERRPQGNYRRYI